MTKRIPLVARLRALADFIEANDLEDTRPQIDYSAEVTWHCSGGVGGDERARAVIAALGLPAKAWKQVEVASQFLLLKAVHPELGPITLYVDRQPGVATTPPPARDAIAELVP